MAMMIADASKTGKADPAFPAHMDVVRHWAQAIWNHWLPEEALQTSLNYARDRITKSPRPWSMVTGPAAALLCTLERVGWKVTSASSLITDVSRTLDLHTDPPIVVARCMEAAVRRWRWSNMAKAHPSLRVVGCSFHPVHKLLSSKRSDDGWNNKLRASLSSVAANRQYPQARCFQAGWVTHPKCIFCLHGKVSGSPLTAVMPDGADRRGNR